jgi:hypothetical protein
MVWMSVVGKTYLERGEPVVVVVQWRTGVGSGPRGPRNVLIRRAGGELVVRQFRGLRKPSATTALPPSGCGRIVKALSVP